MPRRRWRFGKALCFTIEQRTGILAIDREIDVLGDRPGPFDEAQSVKLGDHNSGHRAARVEKWAAAVSGLHGCRYLQLMRVVARPRQSADDPRRNARLRAQQTLGRKADDDHSLAWLDRVIAARQR